MRSPVDVVVPIKRLTAAKTRLAGASDGPAAHRDLALALAADTLAAVLATSVRRVVVVTADPRVGELAGRDPRVGTVPDDGRGLDAAVRRGAEHLHGADHLRGDGAAAVAALQADLPALRPDELTAALAAGLEALADATAVHVADHLGTGTTLLLTRAGLAPRPRFGPGSAAAHAAGGAPGLSGPWPGLRLDVDTPTDLDRARALGVGPATRGWLERRGRDTRSDGATRSDGREPGERASPPAPPPIVQPGERFPASTP